MPPRRSSRVAEIQAKASASDPICIPDSDGPSDLDNEKSTPKVPSSKKGKRKPKKEFDEDVVDESPSSKRARKLPVRSKEGSDAPAVHVEIEIPIPAKALSPKAKADVVAEALADAVDEAQVEAEAAADGDEHEEERTEDAKGIATPAPQKSGHIRFDNDEDDAAEKFYTPLEAPAKNLFEAKVPPPVPEEEEESDDDAAPEAVSTSAAAAEILKSAAAANKLVEQQAASQKRKRKERDALFRAQAAERKKAQVSKSTADDDDAAPVKIQSGRQRVEKTHLPALLPAELLESDDEDLDEQDDEGRVGGRAKKIRLDNATREAILSSGDRGPADRQVGSTTFRVMKERGNVGLAPKASKRSQDMRNDLLARRRIGKKMGGGFLVKGRS